MSLCELPRHRGHVVWSEPLLDEVKQRPLTQSIDCAINIDRLWFRRYPQRRSERPAANCANEEKHEDCVIVISKVLERTSEQRVQQVLVADHPRQHVREPSL